MEVGLQPMPMAEIMVSLQLVHDEPESKPSDKKKPNNILALHLDPILIPKQQVSIL